MNKLDLSYLDNIKDGIIKGLGECNLMGDIGYTATCVEMLKSLEQTKSLAINNYRKLQTIEQLEPTNDNNVTDNNIQPLYGCPVPNKNSRIYNVETTNGAKIELTGYLSDFQSSIDEDDEDDKPNRIILGKFGKTTSINRDNADNALIVVNVVDYIVKQVKQCSDIIIQSVFGFMGSDVPWCMRIKRIKNKCYCTIISADWQFFKTDNETMTYKICWDNMKDLKPTEFFEYNACEYTDDVFDCDISELERHLISYFNEDYSYILDEHLNVDFNCSMYIIYATLDKESGFYHNDTLIVGNYEHPTDNKEEN